MDIVARAVDSCRSSSRSESSLRLRREGLPDLRSFEALRWALDEELLYALAARFLGRRRGRILPVQLLQRAERVEAACAGQHGRQEKLARLNKRYELDHSDRSGKEYHSGAFRYALPWASLPVFMEETQPGGGSSLTLDIADDVEGAKADGGLKSCILIWDSTT